MGAKSPILQIMKLKHREGWELAYSLSRFKSERGRQAINPGLPTPHPLHCHLNSLRHQLHFLMDQLSKSPWALLRVQGLLAIMVPGFS